MQHNLREPEFERHDFLKELDECLDEERKPHYRTVPAKRMMKLVLTVSLSLTLAVASIIVILWVVSAGKSENEIVRVREMVEAPTEAVASGETENEALGNAQVKSRQILPEYRTLYEQNPDFAGWLTIEDTVIDYPVMYKEGDNDFYLSHNFEGEQDTNGLLVMDKRNDPEEDNINTLIHGHNMKSGAMFGSLKYYLSEEYYRAHPVIRFSNRYETGEYEIFAVFTSTVYDENTTDVRYFDYIRIEDREQFLAYVDEAKKNSVYDTKITPQWGDRLITLSTCEYSKENGRLVIVGRYHEP